MPRDDPEAAEILKCEHANTGATSMFPQILQWVEVLCRKTRRNSGSVHQGKRRALLVDDERPILATLGPILEGHGLEVETASSAQAAKQLLKKSTFDLVITDMRMESQGAGYKVMQAARQHPNRPATLILSAFPMLTADWKAHGADAMLMKPTRPSELLAVIDGLLALHGRPELP